MSLDIVDSRFAIHISYGANRKRSPPWLLRRKPVYMKNTHARKIRVISLRRDKTRGYGGNPRKYIDPFLPRFKVIYYEKGPYKVIDRYSGQEENIGQAVYYYRKRPVYGLNYYGIVITPKLKAEVIFDFLKEALRAGSGKSIHRGLNGYKRGNWTYRNKFSEKRGFVEGEEKIYHKGKLIYIQLYHGGNIGDLRSYKRWAINLLPAQELKRKAKF